MANVEGIGWYAGYIPADVSSAASTSSAVGTGVSGFAQQLAGAISQAASSSNSGTSAEMAAAIPASPAIVISTVAPAPAAKASPAFVAPQASTSDPSVPQSENDAYWAQQPAVVQELRGMTDHNEREAKALALAQQGYTIDYQIMVAGWDPLNTMSIRKFYGYTWVPSMLQSPIPVVPGVHFADLPVYDPNSPPAGSVAVTTDFAIGKTVPQWESYNAVTTPGSPATSSARTAATTT